MEERKFFLSFNITEYSVDMHTLRDDLLRGASLDEEVMENNRNDDIVLPSLIGSFRRLFPTVADERGRRVLGAAIELHKKEGFERSRTLNEHTMEDDPSGREKFENEVDSLDDACEGTAECRSMLKSDGADKAEENIKIKELA